MLPPTCFGVGMGFRNGGRDSADHNLGPFGGWGVFEILFQVEERQNVEKGLGGGHIYARHVIVLSFQVWLSVWVNYSNFNKLFFFFK